MNVYHQNVPFQKPENENQVKILSTFMERNNVKRKKLDPDQNCISFIDFFISQFHNITISRTEQITCFVRINCYLIVIFIVSLKFYESFGLSC